MSGKTASGAKACNSAGYCVLYRDARVDLGVVCNARPVCTVA